MSYTSESAISDSEDETNADDEFETDFSDISEDDI